MTVDETFEMMSRVFDPAAATGMTKTLQWSITGDEAGVWAFRIIDGEGVLVPGGVETPDIIFTAVDKDWLAIAEGQLDTVSAFMAGKLTVAGDMELAMIAPRLFPR